MTPHPSSSRDRLTLRLLAASSVSLTLAACAGSPGGAGTDESHMPQGAGGSTAGVGGGAATGGVGGSTAGASGAGGGASAGGAGVAGGAGGSTAQGGGSPAGGMGVGGAGAGGASVCGDGPPADVPSAVKLCYPAAPGAVCLAVGDPMLTELIYQANQGAPGMGCSVSAREGSCTAPPDCCYWSSWLLCGGRPLTVEDRAVVAPLRRGGDWVV